MELDQGTPEWHEWRKGKIGASDAPVIMGVSRFKTRFQLWLEFLSFIEPSLESNFIQRRGHYMEDLARKWWELQTMSSWPPKLAVHDKNNKLIASLDGYNEESDEIIEIKYMGGKAFDELVTKKKIPDEYYPQLAHQLMVTGAKAVNFIGIIDDKSTSVLNPGTGQYNYYSHKIELDSPMLEYIMHNILPAEHRFLEEVDRVGKHDNENKAIFYENEVYIDKNIEADDIGEFVLDTIKKYNVLYTRYHKITRKKRGGYSVKRL